MTRTASTQITKSESNTKHCRDQEVAQRSDKQDSATKRTNNRGKIFCDWRESLSKNRQHSCKTKKQEVEQQEHKTIQNQEKHQGFKLWARLTQKNVNTFNISCIHASVLQSVHITSSHWNICWIWQRISSQEHSRKTKD